MIEEDKTKNCDSIELPISDQLPKELQLKLAAVETNVVEIEWKKGLLKGFLCSFPFLILSILLSFLLADKLVLLVKISYLVTVFIFLVTGTLTAFTSLRKKK